MLSINLKQRILTALILAPLTIGVIYAGGIFFTAFIIIAAILMSFEWRAIISHSEAPHHSHPALWQLGGVFYVALPTTALIWIRGNPNGSLIVIWLLCAVWATDSAAYFAGRAIGGWKLAPSISPNKTWAGLGGGIIGAGLVGLITGILCHSPHPVLLTMVTASLAVVAQIGDLLESWVKRYFNVKDSGHIMPGHGGILDRVDGIATVAPKVAFMLLLEGGKLF